MYKAKDFELVKDIIVGNIPQAVGVILFGSYARGTAREESDMDFAILTEQGLDRPEKLRALTDLRWEVAHMGYNADFVIKNKDEFLAEKSLPTLSMVISEEGVELWRKI